MNTGIFELRFVSTVKGLLTLLNMQKKAINDKREKRTTLSIAGVCLEHEIR